MNLHIPSRLVRLLQFKMNSLHVGAYLQRIHDQIITKTHIDNKGLKVHKV